MGGMMENTALDLIDKLIGCWSDWESNEDYYLKVRPTENEL